VHDLPAFGEAVVQAPGHAMALSAAHMRTIALQTPQVLAAISRGIAAVVESSEDAILTKNLDGVITSWNHGAGRLFGYAAEEMIGKPVTILIPTERLDEETTILGHIRRGERIEHYETSRRRKDGSIVDISLTVSPVRNPDGKTIGASKIARDITERRRAEEQQRLGIGPATTKWLPIRKQLRSGQLQQSSGYWS
jgi:PAS domain S-box-containing protein